MTTTILFFITADPSFSSPGRGCFFRHGRRSRGTEGKPPPQNLERGGLSPQILSCCKTLSTRLLALQCRKMCFLPLQQDFYSKSCHASPRIPVRSTPMSPVLLHPGCHLQIHRFQVTDRVRVRVRPSGLEFKVVNEVSAFMF